MPLRTHEDVPYKGRVWDKSLCLCTDMARERLPGIIFTLEIMFIWLWATSLSPFRKTDTNPVPNSIPTGCKCQTRAQARASHNLQVATPPLVTTTGASADVAAGGVNELEQRLWLGKKNERRSDRALAACLPLYPEEEVAMPLRMPCSKSCTFRQYS